MRFNVSGFTEKRATQGRAKHNHKTVNVATDRKKERVLSHLSVSPLFSPLFSSPPLSKGRSRTHAYSWRSLAQDRWLLIVFSWLVEGRASVY